MSTTSSLLASPWRSVKEAAYCFATIDGAAVSVSECVVFFAARHEYPAATVTCMSVMTAVGLTPAGTFTVTTLLLPPRC